MLNFKLLTKQSDKRVSYCTHAEAYRYYRFVCFPIKFTVQLFVSGPSPTVWRCVDKTVCNSVHRVCGHLYSIAEWAWELDHLQDYCV